MIFRGPFQSLTWFCNSVRPVGWELVGVEYKAPVVHWEETKTSGASLACLSLTQRKRCYLRVWRQQNTQYTKWCSRWSKICRGMCCPAFDFLVCSLSCSFCSVKVKIQPSDHHVLSPATKHLPKEGTWSLRGFVLWWSWQLFGVNRL